jgi:hypothetical protein
MDLKRAVCSAEGGPSDLSPFVVGGFADGTMVAAELPAPREGFVEAVEQIGQAHSGALTWVAQCADTLVQYRRDAHDGVTPGDARDAGDMTVVDALNVYLVRVNGEDCNGLVVYHYDDRGAPKFDAPRFELATGRGFVPNALRSALAASAG